MSRRGSTYEDRSRAAWKRISAKRGRRAFLARSLGLQWETVDKWTRVPLEHVFAVARLVKHKPERLRPDFFCHDPLRQSVFVKKPGRRSRSGQNTRSKIAAHSKIVPMNSVMQASAAASDRA